MGRKVREMSGGGDGNMWKFRSCPKCSGDLYMDYDLNGWYEECLQCGYMHDLKSILEIKKESNESKKEPAMAGHHHRKVSTS